MEYKLGADPEIFVGDDVSVRSIIGKIGGTKFMPLELPLGDGFCVQEDNVALEFNIPASGSKSEFVGNILKATGFLEKVMIDRHGLKFRKESAISFPEGEMYDPKAFEFGCEPDFCAWTKEVNHKPKASDPNLRSCGGHVHIGCTEFDPVEIVKGCDLYLGVPSVLMDSGDLRKQLYGKYGAYRPKPYGVEYRTLSNFWIFDDKLISWVWDNVGRTLEAVSNKFDFDQEHDNIREAINNNNKEVASMLVNKYGLQVV